LPPGTCPPELAPRNLPTGICPPESAPNPRVPIRNAAVKPPTLGSSWETISKPQENAPPMGHFSIADPAGYSWPSCTWSCLKTRTGGL
jgi:hypothetical protein